MSQNDKAVVLDFDCTITSVHLYALLFNKKLLIPTVLEKLLPYINTQDRVLTIGDFYKMRANIIEFISNNSIEKIIGMNKFEINTMLMNGLSDPTSKDTLIAILFGGYQRIKALQSLFLQINKAGYTLAISSRGPIQSISIVLKSIDLFDYVDFIQYANRRYGSLYSNQKYSFSQISKQSVILYPFGKEKFILDLFNTEKYNHIIYMDDDPYEFNILRMGYSLDCEIDEHVYKCTFPNKSQFLTFIGTLQREGCGMQHHEMEVILNFVCPECKLPIKIFSEIQKQNIVTVKNTIKPLSFSNDIAKSPYIFDGIPIGYHNKRSLLRSG